MSKLIPITIARGNGIGPEIMDATLRILNAAKAPLAYEEIEIGEEVYKRGIMNGIEDSAWESLRRTKIFLKGPITTPMGGGFKSLNVTVRKTLGLYANVRPCVTYHPYVKTNHPVMDVVIVRENEEDLYAGIEYRHTQDVYIAVKLISRPGSEKICRYAFEYARANGRKKVTLMCKDNIMKLTDGLFRQCYDKIAAEYPDIKSEHYIIDIGTARIAAKPQEFDVIVTENLYGDIISDVAAEITGSVGLAGSANIGEHGAMFEAIHGSAPDIAGKGIANPSGCLLGAVMMLTHIGLGKVAEDIHNAWLKTIEDGIHTGDLYRAETSAKKVGTSEFADAVIARLGQRPQKMTPVSYPAESKGLDLKPVSPRGNQKKDLVGIDVYIDWQGNKASEIAAIVQKHMPEHLKLTVISNRGTKVWPGDQPETECVDKWRLRMMKQKDGFNQVHTAELIHKLASSGLDVIKTENLYTFDGTAGYSKVQGE